MKERILVAGSMKAPGPPSHLAGTEQGLLPVSATGGTAALAMHITILFFFSTNLPFPLNSSLCLKATGAGVWMDWRASSTNDRQKFNPE